MLFIDIQEQDTSFGDVENYERLLQTCDVNLDTLRNINFPSDVTPKCLPQDHKGTATFNAHVHYYLPFKVQIAHCQNFHQRLHASSFNDCIFLIFPQILSELGKSFPEN